MSWRHRQSLAFRFGVSRLPFSGLQVTGSPFRRLARVTLLSATAFAVLTSCQGNRNDILTTTKNDVGQTSLPIASPQKRAAALQRVAVQLEQQKRDLAAGNAITTGSNEQAAVQPAPKPARKTRKDILLASTTVVEPSVLTPAILTSVPDSRPETSAPKITGPDQYAASGPLGRFNAKLAALENKTRSKPVTIVHIGDSHVASDSFTRGIRSRLQERYGNAGRGAVIPASAFKYGVADQVKLTSWGNWTSRTALKHKSGPFGLSGVSVASRSSKAGMKMTVIGQQFDWAAVTVLTGPSQGRLTLKVGREEKSFNAWAKSRGSKTFRINARGSSVEVRLGGGARTTVLNWSSGRERPGIRYINFGLIGATAKITNRFDPKLVAADLKELDPDLIIYGYGTNEGFNDGLNIASYSRFAKNLIGSMRKSAKNADVVIVGAASGLRRKGNRACGSWSTPRKLEPLRKAMEKLAKAENAAYWDWSDAMGGACAINRWAAKGLAAKDRVHLTSAGYSRSAGLFANWITKGATANTTVASN